MSPNKHFEQGCIAQDATIAGQQTRRWVLDLRKVADEALERSDAESSPVGAYRQFRIVALGCNAFLKSGCSADAGADTGMDFAGCCKTVGVWPAFALQDHCSLHSFRQAEETFAALRSKFDGQAFFHAWPVLLSREERLLARLISVALFDMCVALSINLSSVATREFVFFF